MDFSFLLTLIILVYAGVLILVNLLSMRKGSWILAAVRVGVTVVSAILSIPLSKLLAQTLTSVVHNLLLSALGADVGELMTEISAGAEGIRVLATLIITPVVYLLLFVLMRGVLSLVVRLVGRLIPVLHKRSPAFMTMPLGALNGFLIAFVTMIPVCGFIMLGARAVDTVSGDKPDADASLRVSGMVYLSEAEEPDDSEAPAFNLNLADNPIIKLIHNTLGDVVFDQLTTGTLQLGEEGEKLELNLETELCGILDAAVAVQEVMEAMDKGEFTEEDKELLFAMADSFLVSDWVRRVASDALVSISEHWLEGKSFAGLERPELDSTLNPTLNVILEVFTQENEETLAEDIHVILDVVGDLMVQDLLTADADYEAMVQKLGADGFLTGLLDKLEDNRRMEAVSEEIRSLGVRLVSNMLGAELLRNGEYEELMNNIAATLTDALSMSKAEQDAFVTEYVKIHFLDAGYDVPADMALEIAHDMMDDLGGDGLITGDEVYDFMMEHTDKGFDLAVEGSI